MPTMKFTGFVTAAHTVRTASRSGRPGANSTSAPARSKACRRLMVSSRSGLPRRKFSERAVSVKGNGRARAACDRGGDALRRPGRCRRAACPGRRWRLRSSRRPARPLPRAGSSRPRPQANRRSPSPDRRTRAGRSPRRSTRACASASSRVMLPVEPAERRRPHAPLEVASAWKPRPVSTRAEPPSQAFGDDEAFRSSSAALWNCAALSFCVTAMARERITRAARWPLPFDTLCAQPNEDLQWQP